jgi:cytochrome c peroxidase
VGYREFLFWDGRAKSLEDQAKGPIINPIEMGMKDEAAVVAAIQSDAKYRKLFKNVFHKNEKGNFPITFNEIIKALTTFERTLNTPDSDFDRYQNGDPNAMSDSAKKGWDKFQKIGCISCHAAPTFSGKDYFIRFPLHEAKEYIEKYNLAEDKGRFQTTQEFKDQNLWRVPSLRNVALTAPYFHNGSVDSLQTAIKIMGKGQLQKELSDEDINNLEAFLKSLTGRAPVIK